jgi:hypothetical protein
MRSGRALSLLVVVWLVLSAVPAFAACVFGCGGGYDAFSFRTEYLWPGQTVTWSQRLYLDKYVDGPQAGPFYAYLVQGSMRVKRVPHVNDGIRVGVVETSELRRHNYRASVALSIPTDVTLGTYRLEVCNDPCTARLGYLGPTRVEVVAGDIEARLSERIDALALRVGDLRASVSRVSRGVAKRVLKPVRADLTAADETLSTRIGDLSERLMELEERLDSQEAAAEKDDGGVSQSTVALGALIAAIFALLAWGPRRSRRPVEIDS